MLPKFNDEMCPKPPDHVIERDKNERKYKKKVKNDKKKTQKGNASKETSVLTAKK